MALCELSFPSKDLSASELSVRYFEVHEALSALFEVSLVAMSPSATIDLEGIVGETASFSLNRGTLGQRVWTGLVLGAELLDVEEDGLSTYRITIVPRAWLLTQRTNHRIFQHQSAPEIAAALLSEWGVTLALRLDGARFPKLEYRVQYGETDFAFLCRILEDAGIHYFFEEADEDNTLVLCDTPEAAEPEDGPIPWMDSPSPGLQMPHVTSLAFSTDVRPGKTTLRDFDFRKPEYALSYKFEAPMAGEAPLEVYRYTPGHGRIDVQTKPMDTPVADGRSAARIDEHEGYALAERRLSGMRADRRQVSFSSNLVRLAPGKAISIRNHPKAALQPERRLIVTSTQLEGTVEGAWDLSATALFADQPIRPIAKTARPILAGPQSAIVVGPEGEEIHTDEFGRVRVRFHWDRGGAFDDQRTCWLRVADGSAGAGWGMISIPRVGHEVIVDFFEGNPDEPMIVGRLYDTTQPPPYGLPNKRTKSGWKSKSTPDSEGYNEISFDDALEHEMVSIRAEKDLHKIVLNDERETTLRDRTAIVGSNLTTNVKQTDTIVAGVVHSVQMGAVTKAESVGDGGQPDIAPGETMREMLAGRITLSTGGATIQLDGPNVVITAQSDVILKAGGELKILGGPYVQINPPHVGKSGDAAKAAAPPHEVVWFKLTSDDGAPMPDVVCHVEHEGGELSSAQRSDGHGLVRFPAPQSGSYKLHVGAPSPKAQAKLDAAKPAAAKPAAPAPAPAAAKPAAPAPAPAAAKPAAPAPAPAAAKPAAPAPAPAAAKPAAPAPAPAAAKPAAPAPAPAAAKPAPATKGVDVGSTDAQKTATAKPTAHSVPLALEIVSPKPKTAFEIAPGNHPSPDPSMPAVTLQANVSFQGKPVTMGTLTWELSISGKYRVRDKSQEGDYRWQTFTFSAGTTQTVPGQKLDFKLAPGEIVGGDLTVKVTYQSGPELGDLKASATVKDLKVVGKNPARADVEALVAEIGGTQTWCLVRMFCHESAHALGQFKKGAVLYGPPAGVGIVQRDAEGDEWVWPASRLTEPNNFFPRIFWDWKKNVREGVERFRSDYMQRGRSELASLRRRNPNLPEPSEDIILRAAIRHYNGGNEYQASADGRHYVVDPYQSRTKSGTIKPLKADRLPYVNQVLDDSHVDAVKYPIPADVRAEIWPVAVPRR